MTIAKGKIDVTVLADGIVKVQTGDMGGASHRAADDCLKFLATLLGGPVVEQKAERGHQHSHGHDHEHGHDHHHA